jgi:hypothetical protein
MCSARKLQIFFVSLIFISLVIIPDFAYSVSFGALVKNDMTTVNPGDTGTFEILFYSRSDESMAFQLSLKERPESFDIVYPKNFNLDSEDLKDEYVLISGEYVRGKVVGIDVNIPSNSETGEYGILLNAVSADEGGAGMLNVNAEKTFLLKVNVVGESEGQRTTATTTTSTISTTSTTVATTPTTTTTTILSEEDIDRRENPNQSLLVITFVLMIVFLILLYLNYKAGLRI